jgi:hypothetical protein
MSDRDQFFNDFLGYSRDLRFWIIAYGIGVPALLLSKAELYLKFTKSEEAISIILLLVLGVTLKIVETLVDKWMSWIQHSCVDYTTHKKLQKYADGWFGRIAPRLLLEIISLVSLGVATYLMFKVFLR